MKRKRTEDNTCVVYDWMTGRGTLTVMPTNADHCSGTPSTCVRKGCRSRVAALGRSEGLFTRQQATKSLNSSEKDPSSTGGGF